jgi:hypothetical protein
MDAFEEVVSEMLWMDGYWVRKSVKVGLTKQEKGRETRGRLLPSRLSDYWSPRVFLPR